MGRVRYLASGFVLCILIAIGGPDLRAQFTTSIEGTITDVSGAAIPGVELLLTQVDTGVTHASRTDSVGYYGFLTLPPGKYSLRASKPGFQTEIQGNIILESQRVQNVSLTMKVGVVTQEITVTAGATPVETTNPKISALASNEYIENIPLSQRNVYNIMTLAPGITGFTQNGAGLEGGGDAFETITEMRATANGQKLNANGYYVDSLQVNDMADGGGAKLTPNPEAVDEIRVSTNDYAAQWGKNAGILTQVTTKSGTNKWHGSLYEFHRDNELTSRTYLQNAVNPATGTVLPAFRRNEFGFSLGGPIRKDKTFVFGSFDTLRSSTANSTLVQDETPEFDAFMTANFPNNISTSLLTKYPNSVSGLEGGTIKTVAGLDPTCTGATNSLGMPCSMPVVGIAVFTPATPHNGIQWNTRIDQVWRNGNDRLYGNVFRTTVQNGSPAPRTTFSVVDDADQVNVFVDETHVFSPTMFNEAAFGFYRTLDGSPCSAQDCRVPPITVTGLQGFGAGWAPAVFVTRDYTWRDVLAMTRGTHALKFGASYARDEEPLDFTGCLQRPDFNFLSIFDFASDSPSTESNINFDPRTGSPNINNTRQYRYGYWSFFAQDDWKVKRNLTLNVGLREEFNTNPVDLTGKLTNVTMGTGATFQDRVAGMTLGIVPKFLKDLRHDYLAPRFGFAWDPMNNGKISVRGGFGIFYDTFTTKVTFDRTLLNPPTLSAITAVAGASGPQPIFAIGTSDTAPFGFPLPGLAVGLNPGGGPIGGRASMAGTSPNEEFGYSMNSFFGIQYAFNPKWMVEVDALSSLGRHLYGRIDRNRCDGCGTARINPWFGEFDYNDNPFSSNYYAGTVVFRHLYSRGFTVQAAYTFSKALDYNNAQWFNNGYWGPTFNAYDIKAQYGLSDIDIPQRVAFSYVWELPRVDRFNRALNAFLSSWQTSSVTTLQKGMPYTVFTTAKDFGDDASIDDSPAPGNLPMTPSFGNSRNGMTRSNYISGTVFPGGASAFHDPPYVGQGNLGRNTFRGPGFAQVDFSLVKNSDMPWFLKERAKLQIRIECFNLFNRVNPDQWDTNLADTTFGYTTASFWPRTIQVGLRIAF